MWRLSVLLFAVRCGLACAVHYAVLGFEDLAHCLGEVEIRTISDSFVVFIVVSDIRWLLK